MSYSVTCALSKKTAYLNNPLFIVTKSSSVGLLRRQETCNFSKINFIVKWLIESKQNFKQLSL